MAGDSRAQYGTVRGGALRIVSQRASSAVLQHCESRPICTIWKSLGAKTLIVGRYRPNGKAIAEKRLDQKSKAEAAATAVAARGNADASECGHDDVYNNCI